MSEQSKSGKVALLIDVANCRAIDFEDLLRLARERGQLVVTRAYANYANIRVLGEAAQQLFLLGVQLIHCPTWRNGSSQRKSTADETLMNDALALLYTDDRITTFIIASGDGHYVPTLRQIRQRGKKAVVIADRDAISDLLRQAADECILLSPAADRVPREIFRTLVEATHALQKVQRSSAIQAGRIKQKMIELRGEFDEKQYRDGKNRPFRQFSQFLKEAQSQGWIRLIRQENDLLVTTVSELARAA